MEIKEFMESKQLSALCLFLPFFSLLGFLYGLFFSQNQSMFFALFVCSSLFCLSLSKAFFKEKNIVFVPLVPFFFFPLLLYLLFQNRSFLFDIQITYLYSVFFYFFIYKNSHLFFYRTSFKNHKLKFFQFKNKKNNFIFKIVLLFLFFLAFLLKNTNVIYLSARFLILFLFIKNVLFLNFIIRKKHVFFSSKFASIFILTVGQFFQIGVDLNLYTHNDYLVGYFFIFIGLGLNEFKKFKHIF